MFWVCVSDPDAHAPYLYLLPKNSGSHASTVERFAVSANYAGFTGHIPPGDFMNFAISGRTIGIGLLCCGAALFQGCAKKLAVAKPTMPPPTVTASAPARPEAARPPVQSQAATASRTTTATGPDQAAKDRIQALLDRIQDAYFDYNSDNIRKDAQSTLYNDSVALSQILKQYPDYKLTIEGFCDERGSAEYNLALGDTRAKNAKVYLVDCGVSGNQIKTVSFGKERQVCTASTEACWQKNRRIHITQG